MLLSVSFSVFRAPLHRADLSDGSLRSSVRELNGSDSEVRIGSLFALEISSRIKRTLPKVASYLNTYGAFPSPWRVYSGFVVPVHAKIKRIWCVRGEKEPCYKSIAFDYLSNNRRTIIVAQHSFRTRRLTTVLHPSTKHGPSDSGA
jgi:hypothetical protein